MEISLYITKINNSSAELKLNLINVQKYLFHSLEWKVNQFAFNELLSLVHK